jgi:hypothetical protein
MPSSAQYEAAWGGGSVSACENDAFNAEGNGDDSKVNFKPTVNPQVTGGYQWMVFTSRRAYGNVATVNPYASDQGETDEVNATAAASFGEAFQPSPRKLWVAAINTNPTPGTDPSYPAFFLDGQELYAGNFHGYWVLPQCIVPSATRSAATVCTSNQDCCSSGTGTPASCTLDIPITTSPATSHCVPTSAIVCAADGAACNLDADCCNLASEGARCSGGVCVVPPNPGYPASESITYDFQSNCSGATAQQLEAGANPSGNATVWEFIQTDQIIPSGTSITISAQTAPTEAALGAAPATTPYTLNATISSPMFSTDVNTIDYDLRHPASGLPQASSIWLRVTVTLNASANHQSTPTLTSLMPTFDCNASE